jgi:hypothetical protein
MTENRSSIIWDADKSDQATNSHSTNVAENSIIAFDENALSIRFHHTPAKISDLLALEKLHSVLFKSFIFIHNKKNSSDDLVRRISSSYTKFLEFRHVQTHTKTFESMLQDIKSGLRFKKKQIVWIIESTGLSDGINEFCTKVHAIKNNRHGIWIRGYIQELNPKIVQLFDILFAFDMSTSEYDALRTAISIPGNILDEMRTQYGRSAREEPLFVFFNYNRLPNAPLLTSNPLILVQDPEVMFMDITPFVPVIVEATKFLFNEAKEYFSNKSSSPEDADDLLANLSITKDQFENAMTNQESLAALVNTSVTKADIFDMEQILKQIELHRKVIASLETENTLRPSGRLSVDIAEEKDKINEKAIRLKGILSRVYNKSNP